MDIGTVMSNLRSLESGLSITTPYSLATKRAYLYIPDKQTDMPDNDPFGWFNGYTLVREERKPSGLQRQFYAIDIQGLARDPSLDKASQIATSFLTAIVAALDLHQKLAVIDPATPACTYCELRGKTPTLSRLTWANQAYIGLDLILDVELQTTNPVGV